MIESFFSNAGTFNDAGNGAHIASATKSFMEIPK